MANGTPPGFPGADVLAVVMAAPTDIIGLITRQSQEAMSALSAGVQRVAAAAAVPPAFPQIPGLAAGFPFPFPMPGAAAAPAAPPAPAAAPKTTTVYGGTQAMPLYRVTVQT